MHVGFTRCHVDLNYRGWWSRTPLHSVLHLIPVDHVSFYRYHSSEGPSYFTFWTLRVVRKTCSSRTFISNCQRWGFSERGTLKQRLILHVFRKRALRCSREILDMMNRADQIAANISKKTWLRNYFNRRIDSLPTDKRTGGKSCRVTFPRSGNFGFSDTMCVMSLSSRLCLLWATLKRRKHHSFGSIHPALQVT